jgi:hypothetical protein
MISTVVYFVYGLAAICELALIALAVRGAKRSTLDAIVAHRTRIVRDLRGVGLHRRNAR